MEIDEKPFHSENSFHLAGIIPIAGQPLEYNMDWPDPVWASRKFEKKPRLVRTQIPIFYVPIHPKDRDRRDCIAWSVIHGALSALKVSSKISKWLIPGKYYVSFPYGIFPIEEIREYRKKISSRKNFYLSYRGETVQNNNFMSFTFGKEEFIKYRKIIRKEGTGLYTSELDENGMPHTRLPIEERWSARFFELEQVFKDLNLEEATVVEPSWYYNLGCWDQYKQFLGSEESTQIKRPWERILKYREFNPIGVDRED